MIDDTSDIKYDEKNLYFRDVYLFIIETKEMIIIKDAQKIRDNL